MRKPGLNSHKVIQTNKQTNKQNKSLLTPKHFVAFLMRTLLIALTMHARMMCIWFCPLQIFATN